MPFSLMNTKAPSLFDAPKPSLPSPPPAPTMPDMRDFGDPKAMRSFIYDDALAAANEFQPLADDRYELRLKDVKYIDPDRYTRKQRKNAVLTGETLSRRMGGTWELYDKPTGKLLESQNLPFQKRAAVSTKFFRHRFQLPTVHLTIFRFGAVARP